MEYELQSNYLDRYVPQEPTSQQSGFNTNTLIIVCICAIILILIVVLVLFMYKRKKVMPDAQIAPVMQPKPMSKVQFKNKNEIVDLRYPQPHEVYPQPQTPIPPQHVDNKSDGEDSDVDYHALAQQLPDPVPPVDNIIPKVKPPVLGDKFQDNDIDLLVDVEQPEIPEAPDMPENDNQPVLDDESDTVKIPSRISTKFINMGDSKYDLFTHSRISIAKLIEFMENCDEPDLVKWVKQKNISSAINKYVKSV